MKTLPPSLAALVALTGIAHAHPGHIEAAAGHDHWIAGAAIGTAVLIGAVAAWKRHRAAKAAKSDAARADTPATEQEG